MAALRTVNFSFGKGLLTSEGIVRALSILLAFLPIASLTQADPVGDVRSLSVFKDADLNKLAGGGVLASRGPAMSFGRGMAVEAVYVVRAPVQRTLALQQHWDPTRHSELRTFFAADISGRPSPSDFRGLASIPSNSSVRALVEATERLPGDASKLQLSRAEAKLFTGGAPGGGREAITAAVNSFWSKVLADRAQAYAAGGFSAQPPYETTGSAVRVSEDANRLLRDDGKVRSQFASLIEGAGIGGGRGSLTSSLYWQMFDAEGQAAINLGAFYWKAVGDGVQAADAQYYASSGFYTALTFYQMWPVTVDGQAATLVWRTDLISSAQLDLRGVERMGAGAAAMREVQKGVNAFLRDARSLR